VWTGVGGGVDYYATTTPGAARGAHHVGVYGRVQRTATQRFGLLRGDVLSGRIRLAVIVEKKTVGVQRVRIYLESV